MNTNSFFFPPLFQLYSSWFESGAMPYAQIHYPFENKEGFEQSKFPADFIAEGLDQTRGWFYTLLVLSTALFDKPAFKNVVVNGLVLAEDGKKMSKRLKNYPDPSAIVKNYGADALRLYLINSPVVRAEPLRFKEDGVLSVVKDLLLPWYNALRFFCQNAARFDVVSTTVSSSSTTFTADPELSRSSQNAMDRWVVASLQGLVAFVRREMAAYRLYTVVPRLVQFIDDLTNWYVRLNRRRLRGGDGDIEARTALSTLHLVLLSLARVMAPFTPFLVEFMFQHLRRYVKKTDSATLADPRSVEGAESVHYTFIPEVDESLLNESLEARVKVMMQVIELGRLARDKRGITLKTPVRSVVVVHADAELLQGISILQDYIKDELNALDFSVTSDEASWASLRAEPNMATLGKRLGKDLKAACAEIRSLPHDTLAVFSTTGSITLKTCPNVVLGAGDLLVKREVHEKVTSMFECAVDKAGLVLVAIDAVQDDTTRSLGCAREATNRVQKLRKKAGLDVSDVVNVFYEVTPLPLGWTGNTDDAGGADDVLGEEQTAVSSNLSPSNASVPEASSAKAPTPVVSVSTTTTTTTVISDATLYETSLVQSKWVASALVTSRSLISNTLRRPFLPDIQGVTRKTSDIVLAQGEDNVCGALLRLTITRANSSTDDELVISLLKNESLLTELINHFQLSSLNVGEAKVLGEKLIEKLQI
jgi:isoleucyl-tRNA synthetase